jgi:hypothetical protein
MGEAEAPRVILETATILGGVAAIWFFWDKIKPWKPGKVGRATTAPAIPSAPPRLARLRIQLPERINPVGCIGGAAFVPAWNVRVRLIADGDVQPLDVIEFGLAEDGIGPWTIDELFLQARGERLDLPIRLNPTAEFWLRARSPQSFPTKPTSIGKLTLWFRDHTQREGERHEYVVDQPLMG